MPASAVLHPALGIMVTAECLAHYKTIWASWPGCISFWLDLLDRSQRSMLGHVLRGEIPIQQLVFGQEETRPRR